MIPIPTTIMTSPYIMLNPVMGDMNTDDDLDVDNTDIESGSCSGIKLFFSICIGELQLGILGTVIGIVAGWDVLSLIGMTMFTVFATIGTGLIIAGINDIVIGLKNKCEYMGGIIMLIFGLAIDILTIGGFVSILWDVSIIYTLGIPFAAFLVGMLLCVLICIWND